jgi:hypothetical protein
MKPIKITFYTQFQVMRCEVHRIVWYTGSRYNDPRGRQSIACQPLFNRSSPWHISTHFMSEISLEQQPINFRNQASEPRIERLVSRIGLAICAVVMVILAWNAGLWTDIIAGDPSVHVYLGQRIAAGAIPYRDFAQFQPPMRLIIAALWGAVENLTGISAVLIGRGYNVLAAVLILLLVYQMGRRLTGRALGGLASVVVLLGLDILTGQLAGGPNLRISVVLFALSAVWIAQSERWCWAGVLAMMAALMWVPASLILLAVGLAAITTAQGSPRRALLDTLLGAAIVLVALIVVLAALGVLDNAFRQSVLSILSYFGAQSGAGGGTGNFVLDRLTNFADKLGGNFLDDVILMLVALVGVIAVVRAQGLRVTLAAPERSAPLIGLLLLLLGLSIDLQGAPDLLAVIPMISLFGGAGFVAIVTGVQRHLPRLSVLPAAPAALAVLAVFLLYGVLLGRQISSAEFTLQDQQAFATQLEAGLEPGDTVQSLNGLWYPVLARSPNPSPYAWAGDKIHAALLADGITVEQIVTEMESARPAIVLTGPVTYDLPYYHEWIDAHYDRVGRLGGQLVFIRKGRSDLLPIFADWPITNRR